MLLVASATSLLSVRAANAQATSFSAGLDREAVAPGDPFVYEVTLSVANETVDDYRPPDFKGLRVMSAPQFPSRSTSMQIGGGQTVVQNSYSWRYQLMVPPGTKGAPTIAPARVRVAGRDVRSNAITLRLGSGGGGSPALGGSVPGRAPRGRGVVPFDPFGMFGEPEPRSTSPAGGSFLRAVADKTRVTEGEQLTVAWYLYTSQRPDKLEPTAQPRTDGFWTEEIPSTSPAGRLAYTQEMIAGRPYQVALVFKKALFPLRSGKLIVTPLEAEVAQFDFFGTAVRSERIKTEPLEIEATPLPAEGRPAGFDPGNVGKYTIDVRADRATVAVGEAVTVTVEIRGTGNVRNVRAPALPALAGWKSYEPKTSVNLDAGEAISGSKSVEVLLLPEHAGATTFPALDLPTFDPATHRYVVVKSHPLHLQVTGDAAPAARVTGGPGAGPADGVENVIGAEIRPIRGHRSLRRDVGSTVLHSGTFAGLVVVPPLALALSVLFDRLRERLADESRRTRRRMRSLVRKRLGAAEAHRHAGRAAAFYIEIDRVLREVLAARLGHPVSGLRMDELATLLAARGMPEREAARVVAELEACDQARFAPAPETEGATALSAALERAGELIVGIEKVPLRAAEVRS
jgi:hypothetical protein